MKWLKIKPENCIGCLACMTITDCKLLIESVRRDGPRFDYDEKYGKSDCMKCVDMCPGDALIKK